MISKVQIKDVFILVLLLVIVLQRSCSGPNTPGNTVSIDGKKYEVLNHRVDTVVIEKNTTITKEGKDIYHETPAYVPVPSSVDTGQILRDYYAKKVYRDTLTLNDSLGVVTLTDTIHQNGIWNRQFQASIRQKTIKETLVVREPKRSQVFLGLTTGFDKVSGINSMGSGLVYKDKKDRLYQIGVGVQNTPLKWIIQGGVYWKL